MKSPSIKKLPNDTIRRSSPYLSIKVGYPLNIIIVTDIVTPVTINNIVTIVLYLIPNPFSPSLYVLNIASEHSITKNATVVLTDYTL